MSGGELLLGIDIGTASSKAVLVSPDGEVVAWATRLHELSLPWPGWAEHDALGVWWTDILGLCAELLAEGNGQRVAGICVSGIGPCLLAADADGAPLRPAILYGIDTRATAEIAELEERLGADEILARGGSPLTSQAVGPKLLWLARNEPEVWKRTAMLLMASSFAVHRLTGEYVLDRHSASQCDPLYDAAANVWIDEWAEEVAPGLTLPRLLWPAEIAGEVSPAAAAAIGVPPGTPVVAGTVDAWAEATSVGVEAPGDAMLMYGSTMFMVEVLSGLHRHPKLWSTAGVRPGTHTLAAGMATSGSLTGWLRDLAGKPPWEDLLAEAGAVAPGAEGLLALPYFAGERTPVFDPDARGLICGLTLSHGRGHVYRALLEATAYGVRHNFEVMREVGGGSRRLVAVGGGTTGGLWTQIVSNVTGQTQEIPTQAIGASYGDARFAAEAVGLIGSDVSWGNPIAGVVEPEPERSELYDRLYGLYRDAYPATAEIAHELAGIQRDVVAQPEPSPNA